MSWNRNREDKLEAIKLLVGFALSVLSLVLIIHDIDISAMMQTVLASDYPLVLVSFLTVVLTVAAKAFRWRLLLVAELPFAKALSYLIIGQMINTLVPLRFGELSRIYLATEKQGVSPAVALGSIVLEKSIDTLFLLFSVLIVLPFMVMPGRMFASALVSSALAVLLPITGAIVLQKRDALLFGSARIGRLAPERLASALSRELDSLAKLLREIRDLRRITALTVCSAAIWLLAVATNFSAFLSFGLKLPLLAAVFMLVVIHIGVAIPSAPGRIGPFQAAVMLGLAPFGVPATAALGYSVLLYLVVFVPISLAGCLLLWQEHVSLLRFIAPSRIHEGFRIAAAERHQHSSRRDL